MDIKEQNKFIYYSNKGKRSRLGSTVIDPVTFSRMINMTKKDTWYMLLKLLGSSIKHKIELDSEEIIYCLRRLT